jgi:hypothetical protein
MPARLKEDEYDRRLEIIGKVKRIEPYINTSTKILHECLIHGERHLSNPGDLLDGHGIACCGSGEANKEARARYDSRLKSIGHIQRIEEYQTRRKAILHKCLIHDKEFLMEPRRALEGRFPPCCSRLSRGSIYFMLLAPERWNKRQPCDVYAFSLKRFEGFFKIGISCRTLERGKDEEYGNFICSWRRDNRFEAFLIEQASLKDHALEHACPKELEEGKWAGWTEVRKSKSCKIVETIQYYVDKMNEMGVYRFILEYLEPNFAEASLCRKAIDNMA